MRILYGVVGEGMGHATRSRVQLEHLLSQGHEVRVVVSGRAHDFLTSRFAEREGISIEAATEILLAEQPSKSFVTREQIGAAVAFLCTDAAAQITGATFPVDGGIMAG